MRRIGAGEVRGPRVLSTGSPFFPQGGTPVYARDLDLAADGVDPEVADADAGRNRARTQLDQGLHGVKLLPAPSSAARRACA
ncbi:hypothetical protein [Pseudoxanthomonas suwonensis]